MTFAQQTSLSKAIVCLALLTPLLAGAQNLNAQATDETAASSNANPAAAQQEASQMVSANVHLVKALDAKKSQSGTQFEAVVDSTVHLKDGTELPHGTVLLGTVAANQMQAGGTSRLALRFTQAKLKDGKTFPIQAMIAGVAGPPDDIDYTEFANDLPAWNGQTYQVDEIGAVHNADLHSNITGDDSGVFVSTKKDDVKLAAGSRLSLAIAQQNGGTQSSAAGN
jgi:hypothetical protein